MVLNDKCMVSKTNFLNAFKIIKCSSEENCISEKRNEVPLEKINLQIEREMKSIVEDNSEKNSAAIKRELRAKVT
jgi:hypothetical protein